MKIAHFIDSPDPGGAESIVIDLCLQSILRGISVEVLHFGNSWLESKCLEYNIISVRVPFHWLYKSIYTVPLFSILFSVYLKWRRIDIIHTHLFDPIVATFFSAYIARIPHVATLHDIYAIENSKSKQLVLRMASKLHTRIVSVSYQIIKHLSEFGIVKDNSVLLIHNGVDLEKFSLREGGRHFSDELSITDSDIVIICVGRLVSIKGHSNLLKCFHSIVNNNNSIKLLIVGEGPEMANLTRLTSDLKINENVIFLGQRDDVPTLLKQSDIFALTSLSEGLSCSIIEAMASGLPVIATNVGGNNELVKNNINGFLIPEGNLDEFSMELSELITDNNKRKRLGKNSANIAKSEFSIESMSSKYINLYTDQLNKYKTTL